MRVNFFLTFVNIQSYYCIILKTQSYFSIRSIAYVFFALACSVARPKYVCAQTTSVIPQPIMMERLSGYITPNVEPKVVFDPSLPAEGYRLNIAEGGITITAADEAGAFYARQTLRQLKQQATKNRLQLQIVEDSPRYHYRGLMLDVARFFTPKDHLLKIIDAMAELKLNKLHLHLTDDNGWRIEIKRYPRLTQVGSRRVEREGKYFPERRCQEKGEPTVEKGFYTQDDIREIVRYAEERFIEVIPEIDVPAHSNAALAAYPQYACPVVDKYIGVLPGLGGDNARIIFCAGNDSTYTFLQNVLDEVLALFPSRYIHLGGDEADKHYWALCPRCQDRIKTEGLKDEEALQGYFMQRMARYVQSRGRKVMGWDELTNTRIPEDAIIFGWRGMGDAALKAANEGHPIVMTPAKKLYLIRYQGPQRFEPVTYFGNNTLEDVYKYDAPERSQVMGVQGSLWTEFCNSTADVDYLLFPRMVALAENAWTDKDNRDWSSFLKRLDAYLPTLSERGLDYARSMYNLQQKVSPNVDRAGNRTLNVALECIRPDVDIRYTLDGTTPTAESPLYMRSIVVTENDNRTISAATFQGKERVGEVLTLPIEWNLATACRISSKGADGQEKLLVNGVRGSQKYTDSEWCNWSRPDSVSLTVDLLQPREWHSLSLGSITNYGMAVHKPRRIDIYADGQLVATRTFSDAKIFKEATFSEEIVFHFDRKRAQKLRIDVIGAGACPDNHVRPRQTSQFYFDEIKLQ